MASNDTHVWFKPVRKLIIDLGQGLNTQGSAARCHTLPYGISREKAREMLKYLCVHRFRLVPTSRRRLVTRSVTPSVELGSLGQISPIRRMKVNLRTGS